MSEMAKVNVKVIEVKGQIYKKSPNLPHVYSLTPGVTRVSEMAKVNVKVIEVKFTKKSLNFPHKYSLTQGVTLGCQIWQRSMSRSLRSKVKFTKAAKPYK